MTFSESVKEELCHYEYDEMAQKAILSSFVTNNLTHVLQHNDEHWELTTQYQFIVKMLKNFFTSLYDSEQTISFTDVNKLTNRRIYKLTIKGNFEQISSDLQLDNLHANKLIIRNDFYKRSFIIGAFLSGGSISSIDKTIYHLEIRSAKIEYLRLIQMILSTYNISVSLLKRKNNFVLYIKKANDISDFLKLIGALNSMHQLEDQIIARDYVTNIKRINNLDLSNIRKSSQAGIEQSKMINAIIHSDEYQKQSDKFKFFCSIRLQNIDLSLKEITRVFKEKYGIKVTRTGLNHYVLKIKKIFNNL